MQDKPNITTGTQAENHVAEELAKLGAWVGNFNKSNTGAQPFDQIAITKNFTWCYDVKHSMINRFDFRRIEDNQLLALSYIHNLDNANTIVGFGIVYEGEIFFLSYHQYLQLKAESRKSVRITDLENMLDMLVRIGEVVAWLKLVVKLKLQSPFAVNKKTQLL